MASCALVGATRAYAFEERNNANQLYCHEMEELTFPAARAIEWLNEHTTEVLRTTQINDLRAFQTPGRRRNPLQEVATALVPFEDVATTPEPEDDVSMTVDEPLIVQENIQSKPQIEEHVEEENDKEYLEQSEPIKSDHTVTENVNNPVTVDEESNNEHVSDEQPESAMDFEPAEEGPVQSSIRLYTDSEIGSPSTHATPDVPVRHASFSFASLPPRDVPQTTQTIRQQSLGLDSDATEEDPVYIRAPELVAHEERMKAYGSSPQVIIPSPEISIPRLAVENDVIAAPSTRKTRSMTKEEVKETTKNESRRSLSLSDDDKHPQPVSRRQSSRQSVQKQASTEEKTAEQTIHNKKDVIHASSEKEEENVGPEVEEPAPENTTQPQSADESTSRDTAAERSRLRAPRNLGRPVRRTNTTTTAAPAAAPTTQHIKIRSLAQSRPVNNAPVAPHRTNSNQEPKRVKAKPPTQFVQKPTKPAPPPPKSFLLAQKKKEEDERAAAKDALLKKQLQERRDNKIEEIRTKKREEQEALDKEARRKSDEYARKHIRELDEVPAKLASFETRQEREEAVAAEQKRKNKENIIQRQLNLPQSRLYGSSSRPLNAFSLNQPARPASRMEMHDDDDDEMSEEASPPAAVVKPRLIQENKPTQAPARTVATQQNQRHVQRQSQNQRQENIPPYSNNLHRAPIRASSIQRGPIFQNTTQASSSALNNFPAPPNRAAAPDMRQYATQRPPMAIELPPQPQRPPPPQVLSQQNTASSSNRPPPPSMRTMRLIQAIKESSPIPSNISLPEIHTDSSEDSDRASLPSWATPGHVFETLATQETFDTDRIFGPIKRVAMDDVFGTMPPEKRQKLNMRTSSANWIRNGDALTQVEVIEDRAGREAIKNAGGWIYGISDYHNHDIHSFKKNMN